MKKTSKFEWFGLSLKIIGIGLGLLGSWLSSMNNHHGMPIALLGVVVIMCGIFCYVIGVHRSKHYRMRAEQEK